MAVPEPAGGRSRAAVTTTRADAMWTPETNPPTSASSIRGVADIDGSRRGGMQSLRGAAEHDVVALPIPAGGRATFGASARV